MSPTGVIDALHEQLGADFRCFSGRSNAITWVAETKPAEVAAIDPRTEMG